MGDALGALKLKRKWAGWRAIQPSRILAVGRGAEGVVDFDGVQLGGVDRNFLAGTRRAG